MKFIFRCLWVSAIVMLASVLLEPASAVFASNLSTFPTSSDTRSISQASFQGDGPSTGSKQNVDYSLAKGLLESTVLTIEPMPDLMLGDHPTVVVKLTKYDGKPLANQVVRILIGDHNSDQARTDSSGIAYIKLLYKFSAGTYHVTAVFRGTKYLNSSVAETDFVVKDTQATIRTVPPLAGIKFLINGQTYTTDQEGVINLQITESGSYTVSILPIEEGTLVKNGRLEFSRWNDNVFEASREVYFPRKRPLEAGFIISYEMKPVFFDTQGKLVDPARVSLIKLRGVGKIYTFEGAGPQWLPSNRLLRRIGEHLDSQEIPFYVRNITIDGANVINQSQQRFHVHPNDFWPIKVLIYSASFSARDVMFKFPIGSGIRLQYPDGRQEEFFFKDGSSEITIDSLARGTYYATVIGANGSVSPIPLNLSRDQTVELPVLSYLDMGIIFGVPALIALALLFIGRPYLVNVVRRVPATVLRRAYHSSESNN